MGLMMLGRQIYIQQRH